MITYIEFTPNKGKWKLTGSDLLKVSKPKDFDVSYENANHTRTRKKGTSEEARGIR